MKLYCVIRTATNSCGEVSGNEIMGVFDTLKKAELLMAEYKKHNTSSYSCWEFDIEMHTLNEERE